MDHLKTKQKPARQWECDYCDKTFDTPEALDVHLFDDHQLDFWS